MEQAMIEERKKRKRERARDWKLRRVEAGLCVMCMKPVEPDKHRKRMCEQCARKDYIRQRLRYLGAKAKGYVRLPMMAELSAWAKERGGMPEDEEIAYPVTKIPMPVWEMILNEPGGKFEPRGRFVVEDSEAGLFIGVDNRTGEAIAEDFQKKKEATAWLNGDAVENACGETVLNPVNAAIERVKLEWILYGGQMG